MQAKRYKVMINSKYINKIQSVLSTHVKFAFIFGSANTSYFNEKSDIDIGIYLNKFPISINEITDLKYVIEKNINFNFDIDLVVLNNANIIITNQIITKGKLIINKDEFFTENYINSRRSLYFDFKFFRKNLEENLKTTVL